MLPQPPRKSKGALAPGAPRRCAASPQACARLLLWAETLSLLHATCEIPVLPLAFLIRRSLLKDGQGDLAPYRRLRDRGLGMHLIRVA
jgi:hypothetical protein